MVKIFEALFILALDEDEGYIIESAVEKLEAALAGAVLAELALQQRIEIRDSRVLVSNPEHLNHPILDRALNAILDDTRPRKPRYWINTLVYHKVLREIGHDLVDQGVLFRHRKRLHLTTCSGKEQAKEPSLKYSLKVHLRKIVLAGGQPELTDQVLLSFLYHADLLRLVFTVGERKAALKQVRKLLQDSCGDDCLSEILKMIVTTACER